MQHLVQQVVEVEGSAPFTIDVNQVVRIKGGGIAGAEVKAKVSGNAVAHERNVMRIMDGHMLCGPSGVEFEIKPNGKGKVSVEVIVKNPTSPTPEVTTYEFTVR